MNLVFILVARRQQHDWSFGAKMYTRPMGRLLCCSRIVLDIARLLFPLAPMHHIILHSRSCLTTCTKYLKAAFVTFDSCVHSGLIFSSTRTLVCLSIHAHYDYSSPETRHKCIKLASSQLLSRPSQLIPGWPSYGV